MSSQPASSNPYKLILAPYKLGGVTLKNRLVMLPHGTSMVRDGGITEDDIAYYEQRAKNGPGLMITGAAVVHPTSAVRTRKLVEPYNEATLEGLKKRVDVLHGHGVAVVGQLIHLGREMIGGEFDNAPLAPSPLRSPRDPFAPHALDERQIAMIVEAFGHSAANLKKTGHDGAEIHGAHGYLVGQFLSPATNLRSDRYGGSLENRMRFMREVIASIRRHCGDDFLLGLRLSADEEIADGLMIQDNVQISKALAADGSVDYLSITLGTRGQYVKDVTAPEAAASRAAGIIREACGLPIIVGQRITRPEVAERMLAEGMADMVGMARSFIADPDWVLKASNGTADRIRPCLGLNQDCRSFSPHLHCAVNPMAGRELDPEFQDGNRTARPRRIAVIGAGPGGLEAARIASLRGHAVTLFEATDGIGGQFLYAASLPHRADLRRLIDHLKGELRHQQVTVELNTRIQSARELIGAYDCAVVATGAVANPLDPDFAKDGITTWFDIIENGPPAPKGSGRAIVVDDGSAFWWTYGVAEALSEAGWKVLVATPSTMIAGAIPTESVGPLLARLGRGGAEYRVLTQLFEFESGKAQLANLTSGEIEELACDLVVMQTGRSPVTGLYAELGLAGMEAYEIGDCVTPRRVSYALFEASKLARSL